MKASTVLLVTAAASLSLLAQPATASDDNPRAARDAAQTQAADTQDPDRTICVRTQITGSRLMRRVCRTAREWEEEGGIPGR